MVYKMQTSGRAPAPHELPPHWSRAPWGRVALGLLLALGLYFGVQLSLANVVDESAEVFSLPVPHLVAAGAVFFGSLVTGAGQRNAGLYGALVGIITGVVHALNLALRHPKLADAQIYLGPLLSVAAGVVGAVLGMLIWQPAPADSTVGMREQTGPHIVRHRPEFVSWRVHWIKVLVFGAVAGVGVFWADKVFSFLTQFAGGNQAMRAKTQQYIVMLSLAAIAVFVATTIAGARTWNGPLQGICAAFMAIAVFYSCWASLGGAEVVDAVQFVFDTGEEVSLGIVTMGTLLLSVLGGAFGAKLLMPVLPERS